MKKRREKELEAKALQMLELAQSAQRELREKEYAKEQAREAAKKKRAESTRVVGHEFLSSKNNSV